MPRLGTARLSQDVEQAAVWSRLRRTEIVTLADGREERNTPMAHARRSAALRFGVRDSDLVREVLDFWEVVQGQVWSFRFRDWSDWRTSSGAAAPAATDQPIGTGTGSLATFQLSRSVTFGGRTYTRPIKAPVSGSVRVAVAGVPTTAFTVALTTGVVTMTTAPASGAAVTAGCEFDQWMRFGSDEIAMSHLVYLADDAGAQLSETAEIRLIEDRNDA
jgi:uncharacterized protein (TIGR02217 family)